MAVFESQPAVKLAFEGFHEQLGHGSMSKLADPGAPVNCRHGDELKNLPYRESNPGRLRERQES